MPRKRVQNPKPYKDGSFWRVRWSEDVRQPDGSLKAMRRSQPVGVAEGPGAITKKSAISAANAVLAVVNNRAIQPQSFMTLKEFIENRFEPEVVWAMKHSGKKHYAYCFSKILPVLGKHTLGSIDVEVIGGYIRRLRQTDGKPYSVQTMTHLRNALSAIIEHAKDCGLFAGENPARRIKLPEMERKKAPTLSFDQAQKVLSHLDDPYRTMALMSITTSLNVAELCGLRWKRVNLTDTVVMVDGDVIPPNAFSVRENYYDGHWSSVKTQARNRIQPLPLTVAAALMALKLQTSYNGPDDPVFAGRTGNPVDAHNANKRVLKRAGVEAGVPSLSWHSFRRTTATLTGLLAMPKADRIALMGHSSGDMTDYYSASDIERRRTYLDDLADKVTPKKAEVIYITKAAG